jgi:hypothetical protein
MDSCGPGRLKMPKFTRNPQVEQELLRRLRMKYLRPRTDGIHVSELIRCLTDSYWEKQDEHKLPPTDKTLLYFSIGFALEEVLLKNGDNEDQVSEKMDDIWLSKDYVDLNGIGLDLKSTRTYLLDSGIPKYGWSDHWMKQFMSYARLMGKTLYSVAILQLIKPDFIAGTFEFTEEEIEDNWTWIKRRKFILEHHLERKTPPTPFSYNEKWECKNCRYYATCLAESGK